MSEFDKSISNQNYSRDVVIAGRLAEEASWLDRAGQFVKDNPVATAGIAVLTIGALYASRGRAGKACAKEASILETRTAAATGEAVKTGQVLHFPPIPIADSMKSLGTGVKSGETATHLIGNAATPHWKIPVTSPESMSKPNMFAFPGRPLAGKILSLGTEVNANSAHAHIAGSAATPHWKIPVTSPEGMSKPNMFAVPGRKFSGATLGLEAEIKAGSIHSGVIGSSNGHVESLAQPNKFTVPTRPLAGKILSLGTEVNTNSAHSQITGSAARSTGKGAASGEGTTLIPKTK